MSIELIVFMLAYLISIICVAYMTFRACKAFYEVYSFNYEAKYNKEHEIVKQLEAQLEIYQRDLKELNEVIDNLRFGRHAEQTITKTEPGMEIEQDTYNEMMKQYLYFPSEIKAQEKIAKEGESN